MHDQAYIPEVHQSAFGTSTDPNQMCILFYGAMREQQWFD